MDLMEVEPEIDRFLQNDKYDVAPTQRMISYAKHPWAYNEMRPESRYRLSLIRCRVEEHLNADHILKHMPLMKVGEENTKRPICCICRLDLTEEFPDSIPRKLSCGHVLHFPCMLQYFLSPHSRPPGYEYGRTMDIVLFPMTLLNAQFVRTS